jgi:hypothetical protein
MCFEGKAVKDHASIVCYACALMSYWAWLYTGDDKDALIAGVNSMIEIAMKLLGKEQKTSGQKRTEGNGGNQNAEG